MKIATYQWLEPEAVAVVAPPAMRQSATEGLEGHRAAAAIRLRGTNAGAALVVPPAAPAAAGRR